MGCVRETKKILKALIGVITPPVLNYAVGAVEILNSIGQSNPDLFTNDLKRAAAFSAIKARWKAETGVEPKDHLVGLLIEYAVHAVKSEFDHAQLGVDDSATDPV